MKYKKLRVILWSSAVLITLLALSLGADARDTVSVRYFPTVPRGGEPLLVSFSLSNRFEDPQRYRFLVHVDGELKINGEVHLPPNGARRFSYVLPPTGSVLRGRVYRVYVRAEGLDSGEVFEKSLLVPPYPPEVWSSFSSFSSFSMTLAGYVTTMEYNISTVLGESSTGSLNVGLAISLTLITLLLFLQFTDPRYSKRRSRVLSLRHRYGALTVALLVIFFCMAITKIVLILGV